MLSARFSLKNTRNVFLQHGSTRLLQVCLANTFICQASDLFLYLFIAGLSTPNKKEKGKFLTKVMKANRAGAYPQFP